MALRTGGRLSFEALEKFVAERVKGCGYEGLFEQVKLVSGGDGICTCELKVSSKLVNTAGTLHGGVTASLVDAVSTYALVTTNVGRTGSSVDLNVSYLKPVKLDETIVITAKTLSCGKTLAVSCVDITSKDTGKLVAQGRRTQFVGERKPAES